MTDRARELLGKARKALDELVGTIDGETVLGYRRAQTLVAEISAFLAEPAETVKDGMVLVPREPTKEMIEAGEASLEDSTESDWDSGSDGESHNTYTYFRSGHVRAAYLAMLAALAATSTPTSAEKR